MMPAREVPWLRCQLSSRNVLVIDLRGPVVCWEPEVRTQSAKPFAAGLEVGHSAFDEPPELGAVVGPQEVRNLVGEDVVDEVGRELHSGPVDVDTAVRSTGSPPIAQGEDLEVGDLNVHAVGPGFEPSPEPGMAGAAVPAGEVPGRVLDAVAPKFQPATEQSHRRGGGLIH